MMSNALITKNPLDLARRDLDAAKTELGQVWAEADHEVAIERLLRASEALMRAIANVSHAVERLSELPACDGGHDANG
jgi:hypothetical protein